MDREEVFCSGYTDADNIWQTGFSCGFRDSGVGGGGGGGLSCCEFSNGTRYCCYAKEAPNNGFPNGDRSGGLGNSNSNADQQQELENMKLTLVAIAITSSLLLVLLLTVAVTLALRARKRCNQSGDKLQAVRSLESEQVADSPTVDYSSDPKIIQCDPSPTVSSSCRAESCLIGSACGATAIESENDTFPGRCHLTNEPVI